MKHSTDTETAHGDTHFPHRLACVAEAAITCRDTAKHTDVMFCTSQCSAFTDAKQLFVSGESLQFSDLFPKEFSAGERVCVI